MAYYNSLFTCIRRGGVGFNRFIPFSLAFRNGIAPKTASQLPLGLNYTLATRSTNATRKMDYSSSDDDMPLARPNGNGM